MSTHTASPPPRVEQAWRALKDSELRVTGPRKAILKLLASEHGPFTAEEIHNRLARGECDLVTVYRSLAALEEAGILSRCDFGDGAYRYEYNVGEHHHHHLICRKCRKVETVDLCVADVLERVARQRGYAKISHSLEVFGTCADCQKAAARKSR